MTRTRVLFCDFLGLPKGKYVQLDLAKSGDIGFAACALSVSFDRDYLIFQVQDYLMEFLI